MTCEIFSDGKIRVPLNFKMGHYHSSSSSSSSSSSFSSSSFSSFSLVFFLKVVEKLASVNRRTHQHQLQRKHPSFASGMPCLPLLSDVTQQEKQKVRLKTAFVHLVRVRVKGQGLGSGLGLGLG
jgi:hypothetical protein